MVDNPDSLFMREMLAMFQAQSFRHPEQRVFLISMREWSGDYATAAKQLKQPATDLSYYELVSAAEVLKGAQIDDSDLDHAVVTLTSANAALLACVHATAVAAEEGE